MAISNVSFGTGQLKEPMPSGLVMGMIIWSSIGGFLIGWVGSSPFFSSHTQTIIQSILGLSIGIPNTLLPFFGVNTKQKDVPISDVGSMDSTK